MNSFSFKLSFLSTSLKEELLQLLFGLFSLLMMVEDKDGMVDDDKIE